ncbi:MAG: hypothetical protein ACR2K4_10750 [Candidatus Limnocylindria bacterium]
MSSPAADSARKVTIGPLEIFGHSTLVTADKGIAAQFLQHELSIYPKSASGPTRHFAVTYRSPPDGGLPNPALHVTQPDGFVARFPSASLHYRFDGARFSGVGIHLPAPLGGPRAIRSRWRSIQFAAQEEAVGQLFHELAAVPALYFDGDRLPLHASAFDVPGAGMTLIGGTGGVGKTTLALDLCLRHDAVFAADDVAVVGTDGLVHPNLAYPKIYAYNVQDDEALEKRVLGTASRLEQLQWKWRLRRRGPSQVRRRVSPMVLYGRVAPSPSPARRYFILVREHRAGFGSDAISARIAADMSGSILRAEYDTFHRHLEWHAFNAVAAGMTPRIRVDEHFAHLRELASAILDDVDCRIIRVPMNLSHADLRRGLATLVAGH